MKVRVVKVGGSLLADRDRLRHFATRMARVAGPVVVVHGGGPDVTALCERLAVPVAWAGGRRVTSPAVLEAATMVLSGTVNKRLVAGLLNAGLDAVGLSGVDGSVVTAAPVDGEPLGRVGTVVEVRAGLVRTLLRLGMTPVLSPICQGTDGALLNVNADEVATEVAAALGAEELLFVTDVPGVHDGEAHRPVLTPAEAAGLVAGGTALDGMAVKLEAATTALARGVGGIRIGVPAMLEDRTAGTRIRRGGEVAA